MKDFLDKVSSYNLFNFLLPGAVMAYMMDSMTRYSIMPHDLFVGFFVYYFVGLVISRVGSLVIEPVFKRLSIVTFADYRSFVQASKTDEKISLLSEVNNTYRTLTALFLVFGLVKLWEYVEPRVPLASSYGPSLLLIGLFVMFAIAYRRQTSFIKRRVEASTQATQDC
ncbi:MAG: hypothetical protein HZC36_09845 [Armatimonadetes bacterium]|nr:hypothetical protein [Armatimonadota bacterium]